MFLLAQKYYLFSSQRHVCFGFALFQEKIVNLCSKNPMNESVSDNIIMRQQDDEDAIFVADEEDDGGDDDDDGGNESISSLVAADPVVDCVAEISGRT